VDPSADPGANRLPYDADGAIAVPEAPGWRYLTIEPSADASISVALAGPDGATAAFTVPAFLSRGDELGEVARIVIRAWERMDRASGLGA
jgi:hypothetical protein